LTKAKAKVNQQNIDHVEKNTVEQQKPKVRKQLDENLLVPIRSNVAGTLIYKSPRTGQIWEFSNYGDEDVIELKELRSMLNSQRSFLEKGWIKILDDEVVEYLNLERYQKKVLDREDIELLFEMEPEKIKETISGMSTNNKILVFEIAREKYLNGELRDIHVINAIQGALGQKLDPNM